MIGEITVGDLKERLQRVINILNDYEEEEKLNLEPNTYFLGHCNMFLGISGYDGGYISLDNIEESIITEE